MSRAWLTLGTMLLLQITWWHVGVLPPIDDLDGCA